MTDLDIDIYQFAVLETASEVYKLSKLNIVQHQLAISTATNGLCSEAGELATMVKKSIEKSRAWNIDNAKEEIGDCLWYLAQLCNLFGINMAELFAANLAKLKKRHGNKYNPNYEEESGKECGC